MKKVGTILGWSTEQRQPTGLGEGLLQHNFWLVGWSKEEGHWGERREGMAHGATTRSIASAVSIYDLNCFYVVFSHNFRKGQKAKGQQNDRKRTEIESKLFE